MKPKMTINRILYSLSGLLLCLSVSFWYLSGSTPTAAPDSMPVISLTELKAHDGTDPTKPIYLAMDGLVYDVTAGKQFYAPGMTYHWLTGKDATVELKVAGGSIIKQKYPVVGTLKR